MKFNDFKDRKNYKTIQREKMNKEWVATRPLNSHLGGKSIREQQSKDRNSKLEIPFSYPFVTLTCEDEKKVFRNTKFYKVCLTLTFSVRILGDVVCEKRF